MTVAAGDGTARRMAEHAPTAAVLLIGDEILSGRTKDKNMGFIADYLTVLGIDLKEARVVPDIEEEIVEAVNALRRRYTYVFTTGGIGPTHDDITYPSIAKPNVGIYPPKQRHRELDHDRGSQAYGHVSERSPVDCATGL